MKSLLFVLKNFAKSLDIVMWFYLPKKLDAKYAICGFSRCGNVYLHRKFRLNREDDFLNQHYHSAGFGNMVSKKGIRVLFAVRNPVACVLSNKVAKQELSITSIYISYMFYLLKVLTIKNVRVIDFDDFTGNTERFKTVLQDFFETTEPISLPSDKYIKDWIRKDPAQNNNDLHLSIPTKRKEEEKLKYKNFVESNLLRKLAQKLYLQVLKS